MEGEMLQLLIYLHHSAALSIVLTLVVLLFFLVDWCKRTIEA